MGAAAKAAWRLPVVTVVRALWAQRAVARLAQAGWARLAVKREPGAKAVQAESEMSPATERFAEPSAWTSTRTTGTVEPVSGPAATIPRA